MGDQPTDLWEERALPILRYIAAHESHTSGLTVGQLSNALGISGDAVTIELDRLIEAGYIPPKLIKTSTGGDPTTWFLVNCRLTERGARAVSLWPRAEQLVQLIEARAEAEPDRPKEGAPVTS